MNNAEQLLYSTVFLEVKGRVESWTGTGFFCSFKMPNGKNAIALVSCRHVLEDAITLTFRLNQQDQFGSPGNGIATINMNLADGVVCHPDDSIDLAALIIHHIDRYIGNGDARLFYRSLSDDLIPSDANWRDVKVGDDVFVPGSPAGLHDEISKLPFLRKGIIANLSNDKERPYLYVDVPTYDGQSGSPVIVDAFYSFSQSGGQYELRNRFYLVGVITDGCEDHSEDTVKDLHFGKAVRSDQLRSLFEALMDHYQIAHG